MESVNCIICSNPMDSSEPLVSTKCHHTFHQNCMTKYIDKTPCCPTCKNSVNNSSLTKFLLPSQLHKVLYQSGKVCLRLLHGTPVPLVERFILEKI